jgi:hypothetical protein
MKKIIGMVILIGLILTVTTLAVAGGPKLNPGKWEITTTVEMAGMPMKMPPIKTTQCMTKDDMILKNLPQPGPGMQGEKNNPCKVTNTEIKGDTVIWDLVCEGQQGMVSHGEITYHGDTMEGFVKMTGQQGQKPPMTLKLKGKRIGPCDQ